MAWGFFEAPTGMGEDSRLIVEKRRDPDDQAKLTEAPESAGHEADVSGSTVGRAVRHDVAGYDATDYRRSDPSTPYIDGSAEAENDARWAKLGYYPAKEERGDGGHPGVFTSIAIGPEIETKNILGGVTQYANERAPVAAAVIAPADRNDGNSAAWAFASQLGAPLSAARGLMP